MSDLLLDGNLQKMPNAYLAGSLRVASQVLNQTDPGGHARPVCFGRTGSVSG